MNEAKQGSYWVCCVYGDVCMCECAVHIWVTNCYVTICWNYADAIDVDQYKLVFIMLKVNMWGTWRGPPFLFVLFDDVTTYTICGSKQVRPSYWPYHFSIYEFKFLIVEMGGQSIEEWMKVSKIKGFRLFPQNSD